jgi:6,7-dimethyl-8-ribityllumazine synthase
MKTLEGTLTGEGLRVAVVVSRYNARITELLEEGALEALKECGVRPDELILVRVPGAFELTGAVARLLNSQDLDAVVALGCVIRGETAHFDFVAGEAARGLGMLALQGFVPVIFGVLTTDTEEQALVRAGARSGDAASHKGREAALTAVEMANLYRMIQS